MVPGKTPKLQNPWEGPYAVIKPLSDVVFKIQKGPKGKPKNVHYNRLKPYYARSPISTKWLDDAPGVEPMEADPDISDEEAGVGDESELDLTYNNQLMTQSPPSSPKRKRKKPNLYGEWDLWGSLELSYVTFRYGDLVTIMYLNVDYVIYLDNILFP